MISLKAAGNAREDYEAASRRNEIEKSLPLAWRRLLQEGDDSLVEALASKVAEICGYEPDTNDCATFLASLVGITYSPDEKPTPPSNEGSGQMGFTLHGQRHSCSTLTLLLQDVFEKLTESDRSFPERFAARKHGRTRRYIARTKEELFPGRLDLSENNSIELSSGWYLGANVSRNETIKRTRLACEVAGLEWNQDLVLHFA